VSVASLSLPQANIIEFRGSAIFPKPVVLKHLTTLEAVMHFDR
jgi:hypothetical protein